MNLSVPELEINLKKINKLVENELYDEAIREYRSTYNDIEMGKYILFEINKQEREVVVDFYSSYAYLLFGFSEFSLFFEMYIKAQKYGYSSQKRRKFIYEAFIEPNLNNFNSNHIKNIESLKAEGWNKETIKFEELPYWLITTGNENEYYLYEKETDLIKEKFILELDYNKSLDVKTISNGSDCFIINDDGNWPKVQSDIKEVVFTGMNMYIISSNLEKILSYLQGGIISKTYLSGLIIFKDRPTFKKYFVETNHYLPRIFRGTDEEKIEYANVVGEIHNDRLSKETRHGDNILLSICIPSYNRGKRAYENIIHTLQSYYDEEIEIVISNNGTQNESKEFYKKINQINDARVTYFEFDENQGFTLNVCKVVSLAKGKYILLLSDEDLINLIELESIMNKLYSGDDGVSIVRTKTDKQGGIPFIGIKKPGKDSLFAFMLSSNYISGNIYNREMMNQHHLIEYIKENLQNEACLYYPHMVWELILCQYGNVQGVDIVLINEGKAEKTEVGIQTEIGSTKEKDMPYFATLEGRLCQHEGFFHVIKNLEISLEDFDIFRELYKKLCNKTIFLLGLSISVYYKQTKIDDIDLLETAYIHSIKYLEEMYQGKKSLNKYKYKQDKSEIKRYFENYKKLS